MLEIFNNKSSCIGCGACEVVCPQHCISLEEGIAGFLYPTVNEEKCTHCNKCSKVCVACTERENHNKKNDVINLGAWAQDPYMPEKATSGGIATLLAKQFIKTGLVVGAELGENLNVEHKVAYEEEEIIPFAGSKYVQSRTVEAFETIKCNLEKGEKILFIGTPCQVAAIKKCVGKKYEENLYTVDFLCHGVPSPLAWRKYVKYLEEKTHAKLVDYNFRTKKNGWGGLYRTAYWANGREETINGWACAFHGWFGKHLSLRDACFHCKYRTETRESDITIADFWGISNYYPEVKTSQGVSAVVLSTRKGRELFKNLIASGQIEYIKVSRDSIWKDRKTVFKNFDMPSSRQQFLEDVEILNPKELVKKYPPRKISDQIKGKLMYMIRKGMNK